MADSDDPPVVKIYSNRAFPLIFTILGAIGLYYVANGYIWTGPFSLTAHAWEAQNPIRVIMGLVGALFCSAITLTCLYYTVTPASLFTFDSRGMSYHLPLFRHGEIPWTDVAALTVYRSAPIRAGSGWRFQLNVKLTPDAVYRYGNKQMISLATSEYLLSTNAVEVVRQMQRVHEVSLLGGIGSPINGVDCA